MEQVEELKKKLQCEQCQGSYTEKSKPRLHVVCKHHTCNSCLKHVQYNIYLCQVCRKSSFIENLPFPHEASTALLKIYESSVAKCAQIEKTLKSEIVVLKRKSALKALLDDHHKCAECEKADCEQDMQLCATCHELKFEDLEDVKKNALCPACAIKKHMRKGHHTVDFFPYLSAYNFSSHSPKIESKSVELKNCRASLCNTFSDFNALSINVSENYDVLTDMARRSKSTKNQLEFIGKMKALIEESKSIHVGADSELKQRTKLLQESLTKVKDWYNSRIDDCVDESEIIKLEAPADFFEDLDFYLSDF